jgi:hypothetical protein
MYVMAIMAIITEIIIWWILCNAIFVKTQVATAKYDDFFIAINFGCLLLKDSLSIHIFFFGK